MPAWSVPMASSSSARIMPSDSTPRSVARPSVVPSGMTAPGRATATVWPAATFGAPQTIVVCSLPTSTRHTVRRSASGWRSAASTLPTTNAVGLPHAVVVDALDLGARHGQAHGQLARGQVGAHVVVQPLQRQAHQPNCSRKRRSLS